MADAPKTPPASAVRYNDSVRKAAVQQLQNLMDGKPAEEPESVEAPREPALDEPGQQLAEKAEEAGEKLAEKADGVEHDPGPEDDGVDFDEIALDLAEATQPGAPTSWEDDIKSKLVAAGLGERAAHLLVNNGGRENAEKVLAGLEPSGKMGAEADSSRAVEAETSGGPTPSEGLAGQQDGQASKEIVELRETVSFLRSRIAKADAQELAGELRSTRETLQGNYPELSSPEEWAKLKPTIRSMMTSGSADNAAEALRLSVIKQYGIRAAAPEGSTSRPGPGVEKVRNGAAGSKATTPESAKARLARLIFSSAPPEDIERASQTYMDSL